MTNPSKDEGTWCETQVVKAFERAGIPAHRPGLRGVLDHGDVWAGANGQIVVEVKGGQQTRKPSWGQLGKWWAETEVEASRVVACDVGLLVLRRWGSGKAEDWTVYIELCELVRLLHPVDGWPTRRVGPPVDPLAMRFGALLPLLATRYVAQPT